MSDLTDLLVELCPSYSKRKGGVVNDSLQKGHKVALEKGDDANDLVKADGGYIGFAWQDYKEFHATEPKTLGVLGTFLHEFPSAVAYERDVLDPVKFQLWRTRMRAWYKGEVDKALKVLLDETPGMQLTHPFNQGEHTGGLTNSAGVCNALTVDWVRRKMWNSGSAPQDAKPDIWDGGAEKIASRMKRADKRQNAGKNVVDPDMTVGKYDALRAARREKHGKDPAAARSFGQLLATASNESVDWRNAQDAQGCLQKFQTLCDVKADTDAGLLVAVNRYADLGHIFAFFRSKGAWKLFDCNFGEFDIKDGGPATMGAKWLEVYFTPGFRFVQVATMVRPATQ